MGYGLWAMGFELPRPIARVRVAFVQLDQLCNRYPRLGFSWKSWDGEERHPFSRHGLVMI